MKPKTFLAIICVLLVSGPAFSQGYMTTGRSPYSTMARDPSQFNAGLMILMPGSRVPDLAILGPGSASNWCTGFLAPEGAKPIQTPGMDPDEYEAILAGWSCMYSPFKATDNDPATAWCEGALDEGIGQVMVAHVDVTQPVRIWAGFGKSPELWAANCRPRKIQVTLLIGGVIDSSQYGGYIFHDINAVARGETELKDVDDYQPLDLPKFDIGYANPRNTFVAIKILSVYPGTKYKDTLISEISNYDQQ